MAIFTRKPAPPTWLQKFRTITEGYLTYVAQQEMLRNYPGIGAPPAPKEGLIYKLLPIIFLPGFRLTPWPIRKRLISLFFVHPAQRWPQHPWEEEG